MLSCTFSEFHSTVVVGGTYSGQLLLWDLRAGPQAVQHTPLSSSAHTHPVYAMQLVGTKNANNLVSVSTDGKMCVWSLENLAQPQVLWFLFCVGVCVVSD